MARICCNGLLDPRLRAIIPGLIGTLRNLFLAIGAGSDSSAQSRTIAFQHAAPLISAHPLFGQGFGTFLPNILFYTDDQYLNSLIEIGAVGLLTCSVVCNWLVPGSKCAPSNTDPESVISRSASPRRWQ